MSSSTGGSAAQTVRNTNPTITSQPSANHPPHQRQWKQSAFSSIGPRNGIRRRYRITQQAPRRTPALHRRAPAKSARNPISQGLGGFHFAWSSTPLTSNILCSTAPERVEHASRRYQLGTRSRRRKCSGSIGFATHLRANLTIDQDDFETLPVFTRFGGWGKVSKVFGPELPQLIKQLNQAIAA